MKIYTKPPLNSRYKSQWWLCVLFGVTVSFFACAKGTKPSSGNKFNPSADNCGTWRWDVKTLTDRDAATLDTTNVVSTTVEEQRALTPPKNLTNFDGALPRTQSEKQLYKITGKLMRYKIERDPQENSGDFDYHIVIAGRNGKSDEMVVEIPDPQECAAVRQSQFKGDFADARNAFNAILRTHGYPPPEQGVPQYTKPNNPVTLTITGFGFWDMPEHAAGAAPNGREIHPVLKISEP